MLSRLSPPEQQRLTATLREGERLILAAPCRSALGAAPAAVAPPQSRSLWQRLFGKKAPAHVAPAVEQADAFFAITNKRVLLFTAAPEPHEWFLMLGLIQDFSLQPDGSGSIIFDYTVDEQGNRTPQGLLSVDHAQQVHDTLASAIDEAYNASPWSV